MGQKIGEYKVLLGRYDGKRPLGRLKCKWKDKIKLYLQEMGWGGMECIASTQDRDKRRAILNAVMNLRVWNFLTS
jgi:hypothetical protein